MGETSLIVKEQLDIKVLFTPKGTSEILAEIRKKVDEFETDITTDAGRKAIASNAYLIARSKTLLDGIGKDLGDDHRKALKAIDAQRKTMRDTLDEWKDNYRAPLTKWEEEEKEKEAIRVAERKHWIACINEHGEIDYNTDSDTIKTRIKLVENMIVDEKYQEFQQDAKLAKEAVLTRLVDALQKRLTWEREEKEHKAEAERQEKIRKEQQEAQAKIDAENKRIAEERAKLEEQKVSVRSQRLYSIGLSFDGQGLQFIYRDVNVHWTEITCMTDEEFDALIEKITPIIKARKTEEKIEMEREAKEKSEREAKEKEETERRETEEKARSEALQPDKEKLFNWLQMFYDTTIIPNPNLSTDEGKAFFDKAWAELDMFIHKKSNELASF